MGHDCASAAGTRRYYVFPYDWRQDNVVTARKLDALIDQLRRDYGDPQLKVDVVAHSMGGLIVRYYIQYGATDVLDGNDFPANFAGAEKIRTAVLLGTPNLGSVNGLHSLLVGHRVGWQSIPAEVLATMPSVYELLPHPVTNWIVDINRPDAILSSATSAELPTANPFPMEGAQLPVVHGAYRVRDRVVDACVTLAS